MMNGDGQLKASRKNSRSRTGDEGMEGNQYNLTTVGEQRRGSNSRTGKRSFPLNRVLAASLRDSSLSASNSSCAFSSASNARHSGILAAVETSRPGCAGPERYQT